MEIDASTSAREQPDASLWLLVNKILIDGDLLAMPLLPALFDSVVETQGLAFSA